jgi:hypothetical protein
VTALASPPRSWAQIAAPVARGSWFALGRLGHRLVHSRDLAFSFLAPSHAAHSLRVNESEPGSIGVRPLGRRLQQLGDQVALLFLRQMPSDRLLRSVSCPRRRSIEARYPLSRPLARIQLPSEVRHHGVAGNPDPNTAGTVWTSPSCHAGSPIKRGCTDSVNSS